MSVPAIRVRRRNEADVNHDGEYVLYWMIAYRRTRWNFALQRAVEWAAELGKPLLVLEALRCGYRWASDRLHSFVLDGMADNARALEGSGVGYYAYVEKKPDEGKDLLEALAARACAVVTDDFPAFFLPRAVSAATRRLHVLIEQVDSNGVLPLQEALKAYSTAHSFRRFLQTQLPAHIDRMPEADPIAVASFPQIEGLPGHAVSRWPPAPTSFLTGDSRDLRSIELDHGVSPVATRGGPIAAERLVNEFIEHRLPAYADGRNQPGEAVTSGLSPYLHFGHISAHQVLSLVIAVEGWSPDRLGPKADGRRASWWGMSPSAEAFLDQLITWRELGFNFCHMRDDYDRFESLPEWAQATLNDHASDARPYLYPLEALESAATHDPVWNAAQRELLTEGRIHNYLRMLWGKKILEWTASPRDAAEVMIHLNNKYALDGRDPNSYSGIFWCLGRYDRPWGPERPVFGKVRYMSSENTKRKPNLGAYLETYAPALRSGQSP
jgi:deoxyribodipyrimidine photo-lyase